MSEAVSEALSESAHDRPWEIRIATPADAARLAAFAERTFVDTFGPDNDPADMALYVAEAFGEAVQGSEISNTACTVLCAEVHGTLVAYALLRGQASNIVVSGPDPVELQRFYVDAPHHGTGLSKALLDACVTKATALGGRTLWLGVWERNARAVRFYEKHGFEDVGSYPFQLGNDPQTDRVMARSLLASPTVVRLNDAFAFVREPWQPVIAGTLNGQHVKLARFAGPFIWHHHEHEDELFLVHRGRFTMEFRDRHVELEAGDFLIVPRGVEHRPVADEDVEVLMFEPVGTLNTGNVVNERTVEQPEILR